MIASPRRAYELRRTVLKRIILACAAKFLHGFSYLLSSLVLYNTVDTLVPGHRYKAHILQKSKEAKLAQILQHHVT